MYLPSDFDASATETFIFSNVSSANKVVSFKLVPSVRLSHPAYPWEIYEGAFLNGILMEGSLYALDVIVKGYHAPSSYPRLRLSSLPHLPALSSI